MCRIVYCSTHKMWHYIFYNSTHELKFLTHSLHVDHSTHVFGTFVSAKSSAKVVPIVKSDNVETGNLKLMSFYASH